MAVIESQNGQPGRLAPLLRQAGAVFADRDGRPVAINYGSAAGELAVCVAGVGLVDRSGLTKLVLEATPHQLDELLVRVVGSPVLVGGARFASGVWWCRADGDQAIALCESRSGQRLRARLLSHNQHHLALSITDCSEDWAAIELIGRNTSKVLHALGVFGESGDPRRVAPFTASRIAGVPAMWLLQSDQHVLALVPSESAGEVWLAIEHSGRRFGLSCVGHEAASRYALLERYGRAAI